MMLKRISRIKDYRIFRDFTWPADLHEFGRFNVIYGWNGAGKTTLSTLLTHVQNKKVINNSEVELVFQNVTVSGLDLDKVFASNIRVFNKDFVGRAIFESVGTKFPPVYYFGEDSVEKQRRILDLTENRKTLFGRHPQQVLAVQSAIQARDLFCTERAKSIRNLLTISGGGPYNNYDARPFKTDIQQLAERSSRPPRLTPIERQQHLSTRESRAMPFLSEVSPDFPNLVDLQTRTANLLQASVIASVMDELAKDPVVAAWVGEGLTLHRGNRLTNTCRFCAQSLDASRIDELEAHFNDEFNKVKQKTTDLIGEIDEAIAFESSFSPPAKELLYESLREDYSSALTEVLSQTRQFKLALLNLRRALVEKQSDPFKKIEIDSWLKQVGPGDGIGHALISLFAVAADSAPLLASFAGSKALLRLNAAIEKHNQTTSSFDTAVKRARDELAQDELLASLEGWLEKNQAVKDAEQIRDGLTEEIDLVTKEITALELQVRQHHLPAAELNNELAAYLGRSELKFVPEKNGYLITRGDHPATDLSEGERTAIAFMYFLKSLKGTDFTLSEGIVVIDDPVSSLDSNSLFSAFGYLKDRTAGAKQLFVFTHNFSFFRQVRNWFDSINKKNKKDPQAYFYMLAPLIENGKRGATLRKMDPFLTDFESEYHYLFKRVYELTKLEQGHSLELYYGMPNLARRLLETFLAYRIPGRSGDLYGKLNDMKGEVAVKTRVLRFLHTFSHGDAVAQPEHDPSVLSETRAVMIDVMTLVRNNDQHHYDAMVDVVSSPT